MAAPGAPTPALEMLFLPVPAELVGCVRELAWVRNRARTLNVAPASGALLAFRLSGSVTSGQDAVPAISVTGLQTRARSYTYQAETCSLLVRLTPQGSSLFGVAASELVDRIVPADVLPNARALSELHARLSASSTPAQALGALRHVLGRVTHTLDPVVERAQLILRSNTALRIASVATALGVSERQLERRFRAAVGVSPKRFAALLRLEQALPQLDGNTHLARVATSTGYADQPHLCRELRRFTGLSPARLRAQRQRSVREAAVPDSFKT